MSDPSNPPSDDPLKSSSVVPGQYVYPFVLVTILFALWGFANSYTDPLVRAFKEVFQISNFESSLVQFAFYGGYATMAIPAALIIRKLSFKAGIIIGLALFAIGALLTLPASYFATFSLFLVSFYILTFGLAFLETSANPYILSMGSIETATQRLNLAQAFNPVGLLLGAAVAGQLILPSLEVEKFRKAEREAHPEYAEKLPSEANGLISAAMAKLPEEEPERWAAMQSSDLEVVRIPYVVLAGVVIAVLLMFVVSKMPDTGHTDEPIRVSEVLSNLCSQRYIGGVLAQTFYVGAQITCWTFIIHYGVILLRMEAKTVQDHHFWALVIFLVSRFICTWALKFVNAGVLLGALAIAGGALCLGTTYIEGIMGLYCLMGISACMGVMFPTIYGIALDGLSVDDAKLGSAGLIVAIVGGALLPTLSGKVTDMESVSFGPVQDLVGIRAVFLLVAVCFAFIAVYGFLNTKPINAAGAEEA